jgi:hypothetical protein
MFGSAKGCTDKRSMVVVDPNHASIDGAHRPVRFVLVLSVHYGGEAKLNGVRNPYGVLEGLERRDGYCYLSAK